MTGITAASQKKMMSSRAGLSRAYEEIAGCLGIEPTPSRLYDFANGEIFVRFLESVRGCDAFVLQSHTAPINQWIMEQLIMVDALKRASAKRITVVAPFFGYARQDKKSRGREPISARLIADLFLTAGADRLMAVDLHTAQIQGFFDGPVDHLFALPILASYLEASWTSERHRGGAGRRPGAGLRALDRPAGLPAGHHPQAPRSRRGQPGQGARGRRPRRRAHLHHRGRHDRHRRHDRERRRHAVRAGRGEVIVTATHGVLSGPAVDLLKNSRISEVIVTNTLPITNEKRFDKLTVLSIAPLMARAITEVFSDGSVTSLFDGHV